MQMGLTFSANISSSCYWGWFETYTRKLMWSWHPPNDLCFILKTWKERLPHADCSPAAGVQRMQWLQLSAAAHAVCVSICVFLQRSGEMLQCEPVPHTSRRGTNPLSSGHHVTKRVTTNVSQNSRRRQSPALLKLWVSTPDEFSSLSQMRRSLWVRHHPPPRPHLHCRPHSLRQKIGWEKNTSRLSQVAERNDRHDPELWLLGLSGFFIASWCKSKLFFPFSWVENAAQTNSNVSAKTQTLCSPHVDIFMNQSSTAAGSDLQQFRQQRSPNMLKSKPLLN